MNIEEFKKYFKTGFVIEDKEYGHISIDGKQSANTISNKALEKILKYFNDEASPYVFEFKNCKFAEINFAAKTDKSEKQVNFACLLKFKNCIFDGNVDFSDCKFGVNKNVVALEISYCVFKKDAKFSRARFCGSADFNGSKFDGDVYFHRAIFESDLQMYNAQFARVVNFYYATFEGVSNFSAAVFDKQHHTNFIGMKIDTLSYENIKSYIDKKARREYEKDKKSGKVNGKSKSDYLIQHAENIKDSFAVIKQNLIAKNNLIEANKYRVLELYTEEMKLGYISLLKKRRDDKFNGFYNFIKGIYGGIDAILLFMYRITSNHHSNISAVMSFTATMIVLYGFCVWVTATLFDQLKIYKSIFCRYENFTFIIVSIVCGSLLCVATYAYKKRSIFYVVFVLLMVLFCSVLPYSFRYKIIFIVLYVYLLLIICAISVFNVLHTNKDNKSFLKNKSVIWYCFNAVIAFSMFFFILYRPDLIVPYFYVFKDSPTIAILDYEIKNGILLDIFKSLTFIYSIIFTLCLYSLQKTARKNSIVPS